jgi:hypothetical protein
MLRILALLLTVMAIQAVPDYQYRILYSIDNQGSICDFGPEEDKIILNFNLDGFKHKRIVANGKTGCSQWLIGGYTRVIPMSYWAYIDLPLQYIQFNEAVEYKGPSGMRFIFTKTTIINPARIDGVDYNCTILGNGKYNHFGIDFPEFEPATIELKCDNLAGKTVARGEKTEENTKMVLTE